LSLRSKGLVQHFRQTTYQFSNRGIYGIYLENQ